MRNRALVDNGTSDSEAQLAFAVDAYALGLFEWDVATDRLIWPRGDETKLGLQPGSMSDFQSWSEHVFPEDVASTRATIADAAEQKRDRLSLRYRIRGDDGKVRTVEGTARCIYDAHGALAKAIGVNMDVTDRIECEIALRDREAQLRSILATMPGAMMLVDSDGRVQDCSVAADQMFGHAAGALIGRNVTMLVPPRLRERLRAHFFAFREEHHTGTSSSSSTLLESVVCRSDGEELPVEFSIAEMNAAGARRYIVFVRDLSERRAAEQVATDLRNELAQISRGAAMGELAASLAHELNQPLSATANFLAATVMLVERGGDPDKVAELVALANNQIQRAGSIIRNIREFIIKRDVEIGIEPVEKTVRDAVSLVMAGAARMDVEVRYAFDQPSQFMLADRVQIQQVLVNLLRNASEALQTQPKHRRTILLATRGRPGDMIEISVSDTGPGIDARVLQRIFTPLSSTKGNESMGLGLSICRRIIEAHGGVLSAENRMAGGATFRFTLPAGNFDIPEE